MDKIKPIKYTLQTFNLLVLTVFVLAIFFASFQFYNNVVSPIQERQNRLEQKDQIIPNEFLDETEKTEKTSFDSYMQEPTTQVTKDYLLNVRSRNYPEAYTSLSSSLKKNYTIAQFEEEIAKKHSGKIVRYRLDSIQILDDSNRKLTITAFTLDQSNKNDSYTFTLTFTKNANTKTPWQLTAFTDALG